MAKSTTPAWHAGRFGRACPEVSLSGRLARMADEADARGFPCTAEQLRHLARYTSRPKDRLLSGGDSRIGLSTILSASQRDSPRGDANEQADRDQPF
jgi:hypothetical protein